MFREEREGEEIKFVPVKMRVVAGSSGGNFGYQEVDGERVFMRNAVVDLAGQELVALEIEGTGILT